MSRIDLNEYLAYQHTDQTKRQATIALGPLRELHDLLVDELEVAMEDGDLAGIARVADLYGQVSTLISEFETNFLS